MVKMYNTVKDAEVRWNGHTSQVNIARANNPNYFQKEMWSKDTYNGPDKFDAK